MAEARIKSQGFSFLPDKVAMGRFFLRPFSVSMSVSLHQRPINIYLPSTLHIIPIVKPTRCASVSNLFILERHSTCFGRSFLPSSAVQDCTYSNRHMSNRYCWLLASGYPLASRQQYLFGCAMYKSWTADDGRKDSPKHVECNSKIK